MTFKVDIDLDGISNVGAKVGRGVERFLLDGAEKGRAFALEVAPEDRGVGGGLKGQIFKPEVRNGEAVWGVLDAPHALPMEYGTDPFWPPIDPLKEWASRQGEDDGLAYYVQWKIAQVGIDAQPYMRPSAQVQEDWYRRHDVSEYISEELE